MAVFGEDGSVGGEDNSDESGEDGDLGEPAGKRNRHEHSFHNSPKAAMSAAKKVVERLKSTAAKKAKELEALALKWERVDQKKICFLAPLRGPADSNAPEVQSACQGTSQAVA